MNFKQLKLMSVFLLATSGSVLANDCSLPQDPIVPDGNVASEDELIASQVAIKNYQGELAVFRDCLTDADAALDPKDADSEALKKATLDQYNTSVDQETKVVEEFSAAVQAFKARN